MTTAASRRMAKLESALHPREAVLAWLVEAQQYPSLEDHVRSIIELPLRRRHSVSSATASRRRSATR
jgi:hypothetical protein